MKIYIAIFIFLWSFVRNHRHHYKPAPEAQVEYENYETKNLEVYEPPVKVYTGENLDNIENIQNNSDINNKTIYDANTTESSITFDDLQNVEPNFEKEYYYPCSELPCPSDKGICSLQNRCYCFEDYATHINFGKYGNHQCNYERKSQMATFFLEFILSFGLGHFYLGNFSLGFIKFLFCAFNVSIFFLLPFLSLRFNTKLWLRITPYILLSLTLIFCVWQVIDSILLGMNLLSDWNGIYPKTW